MRKFIKAVGRQVHQLGSHNLQNLQVSRGRSNLLLQQRAGALYEPLRPKTLRWGIAPVTLMAEDFVNALSVLPSDQHRVTGCVDPYRSLSLAFADRHNVSNVFTSFEELANCPQVDAVYISPSNSMHCELCHLMLNHDKHVLCEQPLAMTEHQVMGLMQKAQARGLFMMEGIWSRCTPAYRILREHLKAKELGRVYHVDCRLGWSLSKQLANFEDYAGVTRDLAPYALQLVLWVYREVPQSVRVRGKLNNQGVDVANTIDVYFSDNRTARLTLSTQEMLNNEVSIFGDKGSAKLNNIWCPDHLMLGNVDYSIVLPRSRKPTVYNNRIGLCYEAQEVRNCILAGRTQSGLFTHNESRLMANLTNQIHDMLGDEFKKLQTIKKMKKQLLKKQQQKEKQQVEQLQKEQLVKGQLQKEQLQKEKPQNQQHVTQQQIQQQQQTQQQQQLQNQQQIQQQQLQNQQQTQQQQLQNQQQTQQQQLQKQQPIAKQQPQVQQQKSVLKCKQIKAL